ncbi:MAG TPA: polysaccharide biosynthesis tyrosine autokinase [Verrucomicrobiae bacterium]|jgi:succinoglycan biosynthesis transport protein ExoP|nr:polysaccharide biosynthesis tyrosine autokinase [Verrucomicrobiae bacterium]
MSNRTSSEDHQIVPFDAAAPEVWRPPSHATFSGEQDGAGSLAAYWQVLLRRRWTVLAIVVVVTTLVAFSSFKTKPVYKSTARIEVEPDAPQVQMLNEVYQPMQADQDFLRTQIQILQTDNLAWRTIEQLGMAQDAGFVGKADPKAVNSDARKVGLIRKFKSQLSVELIPGSRIVVVGFESTDPGMAARVTNALVDNYTDYNFRQKYDATRQAAGRMEQQLDELKAKVENSQRDLVEYQRKHAIVNIGDKENVIEQRLSQLSSDLTQVQNDRIEKEAQYNQVKSNPEHVHAAGQGDLLTRLQEKLSELHGQYVEALNQYGPNYPKVLRLSKDITETESQLTAERQKAVERYRNDYVGAKDREQLLSQAVEKQKEELGDFNRLLVEHNILKGEFETNQQLYQKLQEHLKDATVSAGLRSTNIHVVDPALPPTGPIRPRTSLNIMIGFLVGIVLGAMMAFVQEALDSSLKTPEDVEALIATPALAQIPAKGLAKDRVLYGNQKRLENNGNSSSNVALLQNSTSAVSEAYRALRTSVLLSVASRAPQSVLVASASAGEGKTNTAINLAMALAQCGSSVLLIDCDLRRPCVARMLEIENQRGMSTFLTGNDKIDEVIQQYTPQPNLWVIPSGPTPPNPAELVSSGTMETMLQGLRTRFKHVIIDSPPLLVVTDGTILSTLVEGVILVVESGVTPKKLVLRARKVLDSANARVLGVVLNKVRLHHDGYYGSYYRGYYNTGSKEAGE